MNKKLYASVVLSVALFTSCEKKYDLIPDNYNTILVLQESGEKDLTLYNTGEDGSYTITVLKSGNEPKATSEAKVSVMDATTLSAYSTSVGKVYQALPPSLYEIKNETLAFGSSDMYQKSEVVLKTSGIASLLQNNTTNADYVLPIEILRVHQKDSVNAEKRILLLRPKRILTPLIGYVQQEAAVSILNTETTKTYEFVASLPFASPWDFECTVAVDPASTPSGYAVLPNSSYTLANNGVISFKKGNSQSVPMLVTISNTNIVGGGYALPLKVTATTKNGVELPTAASVIYPEFNKIPLTVSMLSTNAQEQTEGQIADLIDGRPATYFHSRWSGGGGPVTQPHHFQVRLNTAIKTVMFKYKNRANSNGKPQDVVILVSSNGTNWEQLTRINTGLPTGAGSEYTSEVFTANAPFTHFMFQVMRTNSGTAPTFFNMAEFELYGK